MKQNEKYPAPTQPATSLLLPLSAIFTFPLYSQPTGMDVWVKSLGAKARHTKTNPHGMRVQCVLSMGSTTVPNMPLLPPLGNKDPCSFQGIYFCPASLKMESVLPEWDSTQPQSMEELSFTGAASHRKLTPSFLGGGVGSTCLKQMCFSKVQRSGLGRKCGGWGKGRGGWYWKQCIFPSLSITLPWGFSPFGSMALIVWGWGAANAI